LRGEAMIFVPSDEVRKLLYGSFEHLVSRVEEAVQKEKAKFFGEDCGAVQTLGVFPGHAIVGTNDGRFVRIKFEDAQGRKLRIVSHEAVEVPVVTNKNLPEYIQQQARQIVEDILNRRSDSAYARLSRLAPLVSEKVAASEKEITEGLISHYAAERPWKRLYKEQVQKIRKFLWGELTALEDSRLTVKYKSLYDGSTDDEKLESFRSTVVKDLAFVAERAGELAALVSAANESVNNVSPKLQDPEDDATVSMFGSFSEDLADDLREMSAAAMEASKNIGCVNCLAELYDNFATMLYDYEVAGRFVERMAAKLRDAR